MKRWFYFAFHFNYSAFKYHSFTQDEVSSLITKSENYPLEDQEYLLDRVGELVNELQQKGWQQIS